MTKNDQAPRTMVVGSTPLGVTDSDVGQNRASPARVRTVAAKGRPLIPHRHRAIFLDEVDGFPEPKITTR